MADNVSDSMLMVDFLFDVVSNNERVVFPRPNPFEGYDERKFRDRFRLSKATVKLLLAEVCDVYELTIAIGRSL